MPYSGPGTFLRLGLRSIERKYKDTFLKSFKKSFPDLLVCLYTFYIVFIQETIWSQIHEVKSKSAIHLGQLGLRAEGFCKTLNSGFLVSPFHLQRVGYPIRNHSTLFQQTKKFVWMAKLVSNTTILKIWNRKHQRTGSKMCEQCKGCY